MKWIIEAESIDDIVLGRYSILDKPLTECKDCKWHNGEINQCNAQICASMCGEDFAVRQKGEKMKDPIERRDVLNLFDSVSQYMGNWLIQYIEDGITSISSAQPEIIHCRDCKHWTMTCGDEQWGLGDCDVFDKHLVMCKGYCAWAERREDGNG